MLLSRVLAASMLILSPVAFADSFEANLNNTAAQFKYAASASDVVEGNSEFYGGFLYNDASNLFFDGGLLVRSGSEGGDGGGVSVGIGAKGVLGTLHPTTTTSNTASAIAVGGELAFALPTPTRVALVGEYYVSTKITSFGDAERFNQFGVRLEVEVSPQAQVYLGYREIGFGLKNQGGLTLDRGTFAGVKLSFE